MYKCILQGKLCIRDSGSVVFNTESKKNLYICDVIPGFMLGLTVEKAKRFEFPPEKYGLRVTNGIYDKDIVQFEYNGTKLTGEVTLNGHLEDFTNPIGINSSKGFIRLENAKNIKVIGSTLTGDKPDLIAQGETKEVSTVKRPYSIYVKGASKSGMCGYGIVIADVNGDIVKDASVNIKDAKTDVAAEMIGIYHGIKKVKSFSPSTIEVHTTEFICNAVSKWLPGWKRNGWKTKKGEDVKNKEAWELIAGVLSEEVCFKVSDNRYSERLQFLSQDSFAQ